VKKNVSENRFSLQVALLHLLQGQKGLKVGKIANYSPLILNIDRHRFLVEGRVHVRPIDVFSFIVLKSWLNVRKALAPTIDPRGQIGKCPKTT